MQRDLAAWKQMEVQSSTCLELNRRNSGSKPHDFQDLEIWTENKLEADSKSAQLPWVMFIYLYACWLLKKHVFFLVWWNPHGNQAQMWIHLGGVLRHGATPSSPLFGSGFSMKAIQLGVSPMTMRPRGPRSPGRVPLRRLYQLAGPGRWYSTHGWSRERAQGGERWKEGPGLQWENWIEIRGQNGFWWDFRVWRMGFYGILWLKVRFNRQLWGCRGNNFPVD